MAEKKSTSRAQKAVSDVKKKTGTSANSGKSGTKKAPVPEESSLPGRIFGAIICLALFILFLIIGTNPEGALLKAIQPVLFGLIGKAGFYFAIPALLYSFIILISSRKEQPTMRCVCLILFVFCCGCIYHLSVNNQTFVGGAKVISDLWTGGATGSSGGLICGGFAMLLRWLLGSVLTYILLILAGILTLLASMKITIPSIIRAIKNRPRDTWEEDNFEDVRPEPAALVVNHIANKRIEHNRQRRLQQEERQMTMDDIVLIQEKSVASQKEKRPQPAQEKTLEPETALYEEKAEEDRKKIFSVLDQIDGGEDNLGEPVTPVKQPQGKAVSAKPVLVQPDEEDLIPAVMQELKLEQPIPVTPAVQTPAVPMKEKVTAKDAARSAMEVAAEVEIGKTAQPMPYCYPPIDLLKRPSGAAADGTAEMKENSRRLNETLESFRIDAHIINVTRGPSVTRYEVELDKGVRLNKLTTVADDIALSLGAPSVRIAPVPGKISVVGIEVPNRMVTTVSLCEVIDSAEFQKSKSKSSFAVGKDIGGSCIIGNIAKMPHMLIAGTTGSGKSVCMNSIIISLLYKSSPDEVKLIMVDPKMVELANYNGIPHLMIPVVTDPKKAAGSLQWAVTEMMRRYKMMSDSGVRDLESYNSIAEAEEGEKLPQLIVIIDELADLMLVAAKEVEDSICRIAQMGRAAGIHLVIATQRPSADVITGLMKANIPSRIAFSVASAMESRIILDTQGAEKLVGKGDMLFAPIGCGKPLRVQGCFVTDAEVEAVTSYVKNHYNAEYDQQVLEEIERKAQQTGKNGKTAGSDLEPNAGELDGDEMLPQAVDVILETGQASVSMLQRRLKLGYARAARIVDEMEEKGIVGPFQGSKPREIRITKEQWASMKGGDAQMNFEDLQLEDTAEEPF